MTASRRVAVIGCGPRGLSVLERLCANARSGGEPVHIHVVDPFPAAAGSVWRSAQPRHLLMNTVSSQITVYTDASVAIAGPIEPGPSLHEWARQASNVAHLRPRDRRAAAALAPDDYPTRALYGAYLRACLDSICRRAPDNVEITIVRDTAVDIADLDSHGARQRIGLASGRLLDRLDAVVLVVGHSAVTLDPADAAVKLLAERHGMTYVPPANPCDVDLSGIAPGSEVIVRGLGLNFFDYMSLLTEGRGGSYVRRSDGGLTYLPSGDEPVIHAGSRRGVPHHARGENQKGAHGRYLPRLLTVEAAEGLRARHGADNPNFRTDVWPLIAREVEAVYYERWLARAGRNEPRFGSDYLSAPADTLSTVLDGYRIPAEDRWDWARIEHPWRSERFTGPEDYRTWLRAYLDNDVALADQGNVDGPVKAALDVLRDLRNEIRLAVDHAGIDGQSYRDELTGWYTPLNAYLSIGPPASRIRELIALIDAGVVRCVGPMMQVTADATGFHAESGLVPGPPVHARALIEARLPEVDLRRTQNPLLRRMLATGQCQQFRIASRRGAVETGGLSVTERPYRVISDRRPDGHPNRYAFGIPIEAVHWVTAAGTRPGVNSVTLCDSDAIARTILGAGVPSGEVVLSS